MQMLARYGGACLQQQHSGGRGRCISLSMRPAWFTYWVPGQQGLHSSKTIWKYMHEYMLWLIPSLHYETFWGWDFRIFNGCNDSKSWGPLLWCGLSWFSTGVLVSFSVVSQLTLFLFQFPRFLLFFFSLVSPICVDLFPPPASQIPLMQFKRYTDRAKLNTSVLYLKVSLYIFYVFSSNEENM